MRLTFIFFIVAALMRIARSFVNTNTMCKYTSGIRYVYSETAGVADDGGPTQWRDQWAEVQRLRELSKGKAPVDSLGATALAYSKTGTGAKLSVSEQSFRFRTLIATMLSPQTKDAQTGEAFWSLVDLVAEDGCEEFRASSFVKRSLREIESCCRPVSFYKTKAKNILEAARRIKEEYNDDIPSDIDEMLKFKGVGPKIAYLTFEIAWGKSEGICVDTHVHRISNRLQFVDTDPAQRGKDVKAVANGPEKTRKELEKFLPRGCWGEINELFVGFGQTVCSARAPLCDSACSELLRKSCLYYDSVKRGVDPK